MKEVYLYVGAPKCGSTFLFTVSKKENIINQLKLAGFSFIDTFDTMITDMHRRESNGQFDKTIFDFELTEECFPDDVLEKYRDDLIQKIQSSGVPRHIIIQENFSLWALQAPNFFDRLIRFVLAPLKEKFVVHIILFIRPQSKLIESLYIQHVRFGLTKDLEQYFSSLSLGRFSWLDHSEIFSKISSTGTIKIVPFLPRIIKQMLGKNFSELFFDCCNLTTQIPDETVDSIFNSTCMPELLALQINANKWLSKRLAFEVNYRLANEFPRPFGNRQSLLNPANIIDLKKRFDDENKALLTKVASWCPFDAFSQ